MFRQRTEWFLGDTELVLSLEPYHCRVPDSSLESIVTDRLDAKLIEEGGIALATNVRGHAEVLLLACGSELVGVSG